MSRKETPAGGHQRADETQLIAIGGRQQQHSANAPAHDSQRKPESNFDFLLGVFGPDAANNAFVAGFPEDPTGKHDTRTRGRMWNGGRWGDLKRPMPPDWNTYYCISLFRPSDDPKDHGKPRRRKALHHATHVIVFDDVGDGQKVPRENVKLPPSYALETSPGNHQLGYKLVTPETDARKVERLLDGLIAKGLATDGKDPGMRGVTRMVRLPYGTNRKAKYGPDGFSCVLRGWHPERTYTLDQIAEAHGISLAAPQHSGAARPRLALQDSQRRDLAEATLTALDTMGHIIGEDPNAPGKWHIRCPWQDQHTAGDDSGTAYFEPGYVDRSTGEISETGGFKCHHGHCEHKHLHDLVAFLRAAGHNAVMHPSVAAEFGSRLPAEVAALIEYEGSKPASSQNNVSLIVGRDAVYRDALRYDRFTDTARVEFRSTFSDVGEYADYLPGRALDKVLVTKAQRDLHHAYGTEFPRTKVEAALEELLSTNAVDGAQAWAETLQWDGIARLDNWLVVYGGVIDNVYTRDVGRVMLLGAALRVLRPGAKFDYMCIIEGAQGIGKSRLVAALAPFPDWGGVATNDIDDETRFTDSLRGKLIIEFAELASWRKAEADRIKLIVTRTVDRARLAYDKRMADYPRRCVFFGTTNEQQYLTDTTGNRRFLPVVALRPDPEGLAAACEQLWAEAIMRARKGELPMLSQAAEQFATQQQSDRMEENPYESALFEALRARSWPDNVGQAADVAKELLGIPLTSITKNTTRQIGAALRALGYEKAMRRTVSDGRRVQAFVKGDGWAPPDLLD